MNIRKTLVAAVVAGAVAIGAASTVPSLVAGAPGAQPVAGPQNTVRAAYTAFGQAGTTVAQQVSLAIADRSRFWVNASSPYSNILALQYLLNAHGNRTHMDGKYDKYTGITVGYFQKAHHLVVDQSAGPITMRALAVTAKYGNPNKNTVKAVQQLLKKIGFNIAVDGSFGPDTRSKVMWFQQHTMKTTPTGVVDTATWAYLFNPPAVAPTRKLVPLNQLNTGGSGYIGGHNCGPTSLVESVLALGKTPTYFTTSDGGRAAVHYARTYAMGAAKTGGTSSAQLARGFNKYGFKASITSSTSTVYAAVRAGKVAVLNGDARYLPWPTNLSNRIGRKGHYVSVAKYSGGKYAVLDPISKSTVVHWVTPSQMTAFTNGGWGHVIGG